MITLPAGEIAEHQTKNEHLWVVEEGRDCLLRLVVPPRDGPHCSTLGFRPSVSIAPFIVDVLLVDICVLGPEGNCSAVILHFVRPKFHSYV